MRYIPTIELVSFHSVEDIASRYVKSSGTGLEAPALFLIFPCFAFDFGGYGEIFWVYKFWVSYG